jgi:hypothetical protein
MIGNIGIKFYCEICDVKCRDSYDYKKHINTNKHKIKQNKTYLADIMYSCDCGKSYSRRSSLYNHKKSCKFIKEDKDKDNNKLINLLEEQNKKIEQLEECIKDKSYCQNITNNNQFNLNIFLNEKCKDAINILEFKKMVQETIKNISESMKLNVNEAITNAINVSYNNLEDFEKPYYTIDKARNKLAVKDENNEWIKDNNDIIYNNLKSLQDPYFKIQLENFYNNVKDKDNMTEKEQEEFIDVIKNTTAIIDKNKFLNKVIENGINPKQIN